MSYFNVRTRWSAIAVYSIPLVSIYTTSRNHFHWLVYKECELVCLFCMFSSYTFIYNYACLYDLWQINNAGLNKSLFCNKVIPYFRSRTTWSFLFLRNTYLHFREKAIINVSAINLYKKLICTFYFLFLSYLAISQYIKTYFYIAGSNSLVNNDYKQQDIHLI